MSDLKESGAYARVHYAARKLLRDACEICSAKSPLEAALRPDTPTARLVLDVGMNVLFSLNPSDYFTLCIPCHRRLDHVELRKSCSRGHEYTADNTSIKTDGSRRCLTCHRENEASRLADPDSRLAKNASDREYRKQNPMTPEQKARKLALQRLGRQQARLPSASS